MTARVFVDTAVPNSRAGKKHCYYDPQTNEIFMTDSLAQLHNYNEIYVDFIPTEIYNEVLELLEKGRRVYVLKNTQLIKKTRMENNLEKKDENDAYVLSLIPREFFRELTIEELKIRLLINDYIKLLRETRTLKTKMTDATNQEMKKIYETLIKELENLKKGLAEDIHNYCINNIRLYRAALKSLCLNRSPSLAIICYELETSPRGIRKLRGYLGLIPKEQRNNNYNHKLREILSAFAATFYMRIKGGKLKNLGNYEDIVKNNSKRRALYLLQVEIIRNLRRLQLRMTDSNEDYRLAR